MNYIEWTFDEKSPIYKQLAHRLEYGILSGRLLPGEDIPSIRSMADMLHLNVNTVARSYRLLNQASLIYTHRNKNYTVTSDNDFVNQKRLQEVRLLYRNYIKAMSELGFSQEDILSFVQEHRRSENKKEESFICG